MGADISFSVTTTPDEDLAAVASALAYSAGVSDAVIPEPVLEDPWAMGWALPPQAESVWQRATIETSVVAVRERNMMMIPSVFV